MLKTSPDSTPDGIPKVLAIGIGAAADDDDDDDDDDNEHDNDGFRFGSGLTTGGTTR
jgi:hypothetical protein